MTDESPLNLEKEGNYDKAAAAFARRGFDGLVEAHFQPVVGRVAIARLLESVSCDCRIGNETRARHIFDVVESLLQELEEEVDDQTLIGLSREWTGDGKLMLRRSDAITSYQAALECYNDLSWEDTTWEHEPEFMRAYWAIRGFSDYHGGPLPEVIVDTSFSERVNLKIEFAETLLDSK